MDSFLSALFNREGAHLRAWALANPNAIINTAEIAELLDVDMQRAGAVTGNFVKTQQSHDATLLVANGFDRVGARRVKRFRVAPIAAN